MKLQIWDLQSNNRWPIITNNYFRLIHAILFIYDISNLKTFEEIKKFITKVNTCTKNHKVLKLLIGNKCDLEEKREVTYEQGKELAEDCGMNFIEMSALKNYNVNETFDMIIQELLSGVNEKEKIEKKKLTKNEIINLNSCKLEKKSRCFK